MMSKMRRRLARKAAMEKLMMVASWLPPVIVSGLAYYAIGKWLLAAIKSGLVVRILLTVAKVYAALWGCAALILVISVVSGLALDPLNRVWRELEDRRDHRRRLPSISRLHFTACFFLCAEIQHIKPET